MTTAQIWAADIARVEWHRAIKRVADNHAACDLWATNQDCAGCTALLAREQASYSAYYREQTGGR